MVDAEAGKQFAVKKVLCARTHWRYILRLSGRPVYSVFEHVAEGTGIVTICSM